MAFANSSISDIIATNIQSRTGELADNVTNNNALLRRLKERGNVKTFSGGNVILQEIMYNDSATDNTNSYSGYEVLNVSQNSPISAAQFSITQYAAAVSISGLEMIQNSGKEAIIDLLDGRMSVAEAQLANRISQDIYGDGTGNSGKNITSDAPAAEHMLHQGEREARRNTSFLKIRNRHAAFALNTASCDHASAAAPSLRLLLRCISWRRWQQLRLFSSSFEPFNSSVSHF